MHVFNRSTTPQKRAVEERKQNAADIDALKKQVQILAALAGGLTDFASFEYDAEGNIIPSASNDVPLSGRASFEHDSNGDVMPAESGASLADNTSFVYGYDGDIIMSA